MGYALARRAKIAGANVHLVTGPTGLELPDNIQAHKVESAEEMYQAAMDIFPKVDIAIFAAAVADYTPKTKHSGKMKKRDTGAEISIELESTKDILATAGKKKQANQIVVGFALEAANELENGWKKLQEKNADMIVLNSANKPRSGFMGDENTITLLFKDMTKIEYKPMDKDACAVEILTKVAELL